MMQRTVPRERGEPEPHQPRLGEGRLEYLSRMETGWEPALTTMRQQHPTALIRLERPTRLEPSRKPWRLEVRLPEHPVLEREGLDAIGVTRELKAAASKLSDFKRWLEVAQPLIDQLNALDHGGVWRTYRVGEHECGLVRIDHKTKRHRRNEIFYATSTEDVLTAQLRRLQRRDDGRIAALEREHLRVYRALESLKRSVQKGVSQERLIERIDELLEGRSNEDSG
jgi:hypothetical protein